MIKLALIGKNISHSKSPELYREMFTRKLSYDLLDYGDSSLIPSVDKLFEHYQGINITAPYKGHFLNRVSCSPFCHEIGGINCLTIKDNMVMGENTDFLAMEKLMSQLFSGHSFRYVIILGSGIMAKLTQLILQKYNINFKLIYRKQNGPLEKFNLDIEKGKGLIINCCSRDFIFAGKISSTTIFWDINYDVKHHHYLKNICNQYIDGMSLLNLQAEYAFRFWNLKY